MWEMPGPRGEEKSRYLNQVFGKSASFLVPCFLSGPSALAWFFSSFLIYYDPAMNPHCMSTPCLKDFILQTPEPHDCLDFKKLHSSRYLVIATENVLKQSCYLWLSILAAHLKHRQSFKRIQVFGFRHRLRELRFPEVYFRHLTFQKAVFLARFHPFCLLAYLTSTSALRTLRRHLWPFHCITPSLAHPTC